MNSDYTMSMYNIKYIIISVYDILQRAFRVFFINLK